MSTGACSFCSSIGLLVEQYDEARARELIPALNRHLKDLRVLLTRFKTLNRDIQYRITPSNERTSRALSVSSLNLTPIDSVCGTFKDDIDGFWLGDSTEVHAELRRRLACVVIYLRSELDMNASVTPQLARIFPGQLNLTHLRSSGKKYIKIARKLGGLGTLFWLPLSIPPSTWERYLTLDDEDVWNHLISLGQQAQDYTDFVKRLISCQIRDPPSSLPYYNLVVNHIDVITASDQFLLLLYVLGPSSIPEILLRGVRSHQRRWNEEGEIESISAADFGIPAYVIHLLSDEKTLLQIVESPYVIASTLEDGTVAWSPRPDMVSFFSEVLSPHTIQELGAIALRLICFNCPPCYEGNVRWSQPLKEAVWSMLHGAAKNYRVETKLRTQVLEAILYFSERDSVSIRRISIDQSRTFLRKPMPYYLHATVTLFQSVICRIEGDFAKSEAHLRDFAWKGPKPTTRRDHALQGRLHISQIENKVKCLDNDIPSFIYKWEAEQPLSTLEMEVTFRLQGAAARFFQSIGDFEAAKSSLEQSLSLDTTKPIRHNTRRLLTCRLADIYCEMHEFAMALEILQPDLDSIDEPYRSRRMFRKILLASVEAYIGLGRLEVAKSLLKKLEDTGPFALEDLHDQQLHIRELLAAARITHIQASPSVAVSRWKFALEEVRGMYTLKSEAGFTAAVIYLSLAHAQLQAGDVGGAQVSWANGLDIMRHEKREYWIPIVPTAWLQKIAIEVHQAQGWYFRMMLPGGKPTLYFHNFQILI